MSSELSPSEIYVINLNCNDPKYYSQIPGVIYHCTYIIQEKDKDGQLIHVRKKVSARAIAFYGLIKQLGGMSGKSWASRDTLAEMLDVATGSITALKKELQQPMEQLNGKSLIEIQKRKKHSESGSTEYDEITPVHIWPENNAYMATLKHQQKLPLGIVHNLGAPSNIDSAKDAPSNIDSASQGAPSNIDTNQNNREQKESVKETEQKALPPDCSFSKNDSDVLTDVFLECEKLKDILRRAGADENFIRWVFQNYTPEQIKQAGKTVHIQDQKTPILNKIAYMRSVLKKMFP